MHESTQKPCLMTCLSDQEPGLITCLMNRTSTDRPHDLPIYQNCHRTVSPTKLAGHSFTYLI
uniref:Uncharacterized protein n=1 Tax=Picea glauca TaxID=3330 RepID=A0A117NIH3_PICGL|nr:hypothetical protein ABT39_MTgene3156 [Picea glauca]